MNFSFFEKIIVFLFILISCFIFYEETVLRIRLVLTGKPLKRRFINNILKRIKRVILKVFFHKNITKFRLITGSAHFFIFWAFILYLILIPDLLLFFFFGISFLRNTGGFWSFYRFLLDTISLFTLFSIFYLGTRRFIIRPASITSPNPLNRVLQRKKTVKVQLESFFILFLIFFIIITYFLEESTGVVLYRENINPSGRWIGNLLSVFFSPSHLTNFLNEFSLVFHIIAVFTFLSLIAKSKHFHIFTGFMNVFLSREKPYGTLERINFEKEGEIFGASYANDLSWKNLFDSFACIECGKCQDECPAYMAKTSLSPKYLIQNLRELIIEEKHKILGKQKNKTVLVNGILTEEALWACTTCGACMESCPMEIEHIPVIMDIRRNEVLEKSRFPLELKNILKGMEVQKNPWGLWQEERKKWYEDLDVPLIENTSRFEFLFWTGCAISFDEKARNIARSIVKILKSAEIPFTILGEKEICTGDPLRRIGQEYLFESFALELTELLNKHNIKKILTACPHCYHTLKYEYPEFGFNTEVLHSSQFIAELIKKGKLKVSFENKKFVYHDPCYLGRHSGIYAQPREILKKIGILVEPEHSGKRGLCCGAGGARMWMETKTGEKINIIRTKELLLKKAETVAVACPFCLRMIEDAKHELGNENFQVKDISEIVAEKIQ